MRIHICLVSDDEEAIGLVRRERVALIPKTQREHARIKDLGVEFSITAYNPKSATTPLASYLLEDQRDEFIILLLDKAVSHVITEFSAACFVAEVEFAVHPRTNYKNYFAERTSRLLKNVVSFLSVIRDGANEQAMQLPFRTFSAKQLQDLREVCRDEALSPDFTNRVISHVEDLKKRRRPHRKSNYPEQHFADDDEKLFRYGMEEHARLATGVPHTPVCVLTGTYRFGKRMPTNRHYNVTKEFGKETQISGEFVNCHDEQYTVTSTTHLNIFANDYRA